MTNPPDETPTELLANGVETARAARAADVRAELEGAAIDVETARRETAAALKAEQVATAADIEAVRKELAATLEADRKRHNVDAERRITVRAHQINQRFGILYAITVTAFLLLGVRTEVNAQDNQATTVTVKQGLYSACQQRVITATRYNQGREALVQITANTPRNPPLTPDTRAALVQQLRDGLLLPIEECGPPPQ